MKLGIHIKMGDGRVGTVVYNGLDGVGIKWGRHNPSPNEFIGTSGNTVALAPDSLAGDPDWSWQPDAMLREPYPGADFPCVGDDWEILRDEGG